LIDAIRVSDLVLPREGAIATTALQTAERMHREMVMQGMQREPEMRRLLGGEMVRARVWAGIVGGEDLWMDVAAELLPDF
jgi:hypothetical protein